MLDDPADFAAICAENGETFTRMAFGDSPDPPPSFIAGDIYCPGCSGPRRVRLTPLSPLRTPTPVVPLPASNIPGAPARQERVMGLDVADTSFEAIAAQIAPAVITGNCVQDDTAFTFVVFEGPEGYELAVFPNKRGGLSTPNTPKEVAYCLDQAQRAQSSGGVCAAMGMYRAAADCLMYEQGFRVGMLGKKMAALDAAIQAGNAPAWATGLNPDYLSVLKDLGNASLHVDGKDVAALEEELRTLFPHVVVTLTELLDVVYERPAKDKARLAALQAGHATIKKI